MIRVIQLTLAKKAMLANTNKRHMKKYFEEQYITQEKYTKDFAVKTLIDRWIMWHCY